MNIAILGFDIEGRASYDYLRVRLNEQDFTVTICDQKGDIPVPHNAGAQLGPEYLNNLDRFDLLIRTPGLHPKRILEHNSPDILTKVTTGTNEFFKVCPTKNIIGVTGTKGKGTASMLICKMLEAAGKIVHLGGNIGTPALDLLKKGIQPDDWVVLELSSFQLIDLQYSPHIAVSLMIMPEHLNWHTDLVEYIGAKSNIFLHQTPEDLAVYYEANEASRQIATISKGQKIPYFAEPGATVHGDAVYIGQQEICKTSRIKLLGKHNWQNVCAAATVAWQATQNIEAIRSVLISFSGLPHRLEYIRELDGVHYYDDSFSTTPETAQVAIEAFAQPKVVILGGSSKGATYEGLAKSIMAQDVRSVVVIGETGHDIRVALLAKGFRDVVEGGATMDDIVDTARRQARPGDIVLLSPGCASFDMFGNYKERGEKFTEAVRSK